MKVELLKVDNLHVSVENKEILKGINLSVCSGEVHAIMGRNASGKSTLAYTIMGHPRYKVKNGNMFFNGEDIKNLSTDERARKGIFLGFQQPVSIPGVTISNMLRTSVKALKGNNLPVKEFMEHLKKNMAKLQIDERFLKRYVNDGFSGGERKRFEILQLAMLKPRMIVLDEIDSGLDIDALRIVSEGINSILNEDIGILLITHYQRILNYIKPHYVHILLDGRIVKSGGPELASELEKSGYENISKNG